VWRREHWQFPGGASIPAGGYIVLAKDVKDTLTVDVVGFDGDDGYERAFGSLTDFEMVDLSYGHDTDDPRVPNMTLLTPAATNDQIGFIPGNSDYGRAARHSTTRRCTCTTAFPAAAASGSGRHRVSDRELRRDVRPRTGSSDNDAFYLSGRRRDALTPRHQQRHEQQSVDLLLGRRRPRR
jgi:hypothetical protein